MSGVSLKKGEDEFWIADTLYAELPPGNEQPVIRGEYLTGRPVTGENQSHSVRFPVNRFFAEKSRAKDLEKVRQ